jgi:hypothetical protein
LSIPGLTTNDWIRDDAPDHGDFVDGELVVSENPAGERTLDVILNAIAAGQDRM